MREIVSTFFIGFAHRLLLRTLYPVHVQVGDSLRHVHTSERQPSAHTHITVIIMVLYDYKCVDYNNISLYPQDKYMVISDKNDEPFYIRGPQCVLSQKSLRSLRDTSRPQRLTLIFSMHNPNFLTMLKRIKDTLANLILEDPSHFFSNDVQMDEIESVVRESFSDYYKTVLSKKMIMMQVLSNDTSTPFGNRDEVQLTAESEAGTKVDLESIDETTVFYPVLRLSGVSIKKEEELLIQFSLSKIVLKQKEGVTLDSTAGKEREQIDKHMQDHEHKQENERMSEQENEKEKEQEHATGGPFGHEAFATTTRGATVDERTVEHEDGHVPIKPSSENPETSQSFEKKHDSTGDKRGDACAHENDDVSKSSDALTGSEALALDYEEVELDGQNLECATDSFAVKRPEQFYIGQLNQFKKILSQRRHDHMKDWLQKNRIHGATILLDEEEFEYDSDDESFVSS